MFSIFHIILKENNDAEKEIEIKNEMKEEVEELKEEQVSVDENVPLLVDNEQGGEKKEKKKKEAGIIYLSRIPNRMNVKIIRDYFSQFGQIDRIYLEPRGERDLRN